MLSKKSATIKLNALIFKHANNDVIVIQKIE